MDTPHAAPWRDRLYEIIFESDTPAGKAFDVALLAAILSSVLVVLLDSVESVHRTVGDQLLIAEWIFTILFTVEYVLRILAVRRPVAYVASFYGVVDLLAILPTYVSLLIPGSQALLVVRALRLLRVFRIMKLIHFVGEATVLAAAIRASARKIIVFVVAVLILVLIVGSAMYLIEPEESGFTSIPTSIYWAIVTLTTVGYGDIAPQTVAGRFLAGLLMITGYGIIAIPTGIVTVEMARAKPDGVSGQGCPSCAREGHDLDASHCKYCGAKL